MNELHETNSTTHGKRRRILVGALMATTILAGGIGVHAWANENSTGPLTAAPVSPNAFSDQGFAPLVAKVRSAVVNIATTEKVDKSEMQQQMPQFPPGSPFAEMFRHFQGPMEQQESATRHALGSGFIVDADGTIVTNNHVIRGAKKIMVTLEDGTTYPAIVKGYDEKTDLAVLKIDAKKPLPYVSFGDSDQAKTGNWVIAVGNPFGLGGTVTAGIVSAHGRDLNDGPYDNFLQIDAPINPGNSGGPLFNQHGQVIGIDSAIYSPNGGSVGIGFAIPSDLAKPVVAQLREHGSVERGWLGVQMQPLTEPLAKAMSRPDTTGVLVDEVQPDSPALKAGLEQGDLITAYNGKPIKDPRSLAMAVAGTHAGTAVKVEVVRNGENKSLDVTISEQQKDGNVASATQSGEGPVGLALDALTPDNRSHLGVDASVQGVVVARVAPDSRAAESGVRPNDVIVKIGDEAVKTPQQAANSIHAAEKAKKEAVPLLVMRDGTTYYLALQLAAS